jgi:AcrR family transcriptional regulator
VQTVPAPNRKLEQGARSREKILEAASRLMANRGYAATSISHISEECGLPPSSIYWHFGSKEELLAAVMEHGAERWFAGLPSWHALPGTADERLAQSIDVVANRLAAHPEFLRLYILLSIERRELDPASLAPIRRIRERAIGGWRAMIAAALAPLDASPFVEQLAEEIARFVICFCDGCFVSHQIDPTMTNLRRLFEDLRISILAISRERVAEHGAAAATRPGTAPATEVRWESAPENNTARACVTAVPSSPMASASPT